MYDLSYTAGLFDGEGCVNIWKHNDRGVVRHRLRATLSSIYQPITTWLQAKYGGSVTKYNRSNRQHRTLYTWYIYGERCAEFLKAILPYLRIKKYEALLGIDFQSRFTLGRGEMTEEEFAIRERYSLVMHELKRYEYV